MAHFKAELEVNEPNQKVKFEGEQMHICLNLGKRVGAHVKDGVSQGRGRGQGA